VRSFTTNIWVLSLSLALFLVLTLCLWFIVWTDVIVRFRNIILQFCVKNLMGNSFPSTWNGCQCRVCVCVCALLSTDRDIWWASMTLKNWGGLVQQWWNKLSKCKGFIFFSHLIFIWQILVWLWRINGTLVGRLITFTLKEKWFFEGKSLIVCQSVYLFICSSVSFQITFASFCQNFSERHCVAELGSGHRIWVSATTNPRGSWFQFLMSRSKRVSCFIPNQTQHQGKSEICQTRELSILHSIAKWTLNKKKGSAEDNWK
jgi:hypothetical protein